jgi:hypothetical protein
VKGAKQGVGQLLEEPETRVDGYSSPRAKKPVLRVSKAGSSILKCKGTDWVEALYIR